MRPTSLRAVSLLFAAALSIQARAADNISVGSGVASGSQIDVGVFVSDNAGSTLNVTDAPDRRIQSLGFKIDFAPASAVSSISITRAGVLGSLTPLFESTPSTSTSASYIASFSQPIPFTLNGGDQIANVSITFSSSASAGSTLTLTLDPNATALSNQGGTIEETALNGQLTLGNGSVSIAVPQFSMTGAQSIRFGSEGMLTVQMGSGQGVDVNVATSSSSANVSVPPFVTIPAGQTAATFAARGESVGSATVTATLPQSLGSATASLSVSVTAPLLSLEAGPQALGVGENRNASASVDGAGVVPIDITLSSSDAGVVSVPSSVQIAAGQSSAAFTITGASAGSATITATLPAQAGGGTTTASFNVAVFTAPPAPDGPQPADGAVDVPAPVFLQWNGGAGVQSYDVFFGTAENPPLLTMASTPGIGVITSPGVRYFWRIVARNPAGEASSPVWSFTVRTSSGCITPSAPTLSAPASTPTSQSYTVSWSTVPGATEYQVDESSDPNFAVKATTTVSAPATTAAFAHDTTTDIAFYYRVRARSTGASCDQSGPYSTIATVVVRGTAGPALRIIPAVASGPGANSSFFRTSVQLHNPGSTAISGRFVFHAAGRSGSDDDPRLNYTLGPRESRSYADIVGDMSQAGLGSLDLIADFGALPRVVVRVFNDAAANGTSGTTQPLIDPDAALKPGSTGVLIAPVDTKSARFNIGVRTLAEPATITFNLISRTGAQMTQVTRDYPATFFEQRSASDLLGVSPGDSDVIEIKVVSGRAIVYGSTTDNVTQDPSLQVETQP